MLTHFMFPCELVFLLEVADPVPELVHAQDTDQVFAKCVRSLVVLSGLSGVDAWPRLVLSSRQFSVAQSSSLTCGTRAPVHVKPFRTKKCGALVVV